MQRTALPFLPLVLILALAFGSVTRATAHLAHGTGTLVDLCVDGTVRQIAVGPNGDPQPAQWHDCNACLVMSGLAAPIPSQAQDFLPITRAAHFLPRVAPSQRGPVLTAAHARAPPVTV